MHITEFVSDEAARRHVKAIERLADGKGEANYRSDFLGGYWRNPDDFAVVLFFPQYDNDPEDEVGLHISVRIGKIVVDHSGVAPFDSQRAEETIIRLGLMKAQVENVLAGLSERLPNEKLATIPAEARDCASLTTSAYGGSAENLNHNMISDITLTLHQRECEIKGVFSIAPPLIGSGPVHGNIVGETVYFEVSGLTNDAGVTIAFTGEVREGGIVGTYQVPAREEAGLWQVEVRRDLEEAMEGLYWIAVDAAQISRDFTFHEANRRLVEVLESEYFRYADSLENLGINPLSDWPYCINGISVLVDLKVARDARSPAEAAPSINRAIDGFQGMELDVDIAGEVLLDENSSVDRDSIKCDDFSEEVFLYRGLRDVRENSTFMIQSPGPFEAGDSVHWDFTWNIQGYVYGDGLKTDKFLTSNGALNTIVEGSTFEGSLDGANIFGSFDGVEVEFDEFSVSGKCAGTVIHYSGRFIATKIVGTFQGSMIPPDSSCYSGFGNFIATLK